MEKVENIKKINSELEKLGEWKIEVGDTIKIISDNENYEDYLDKEWTIENIAYDTGGHPGYDEGLSGQALVDCIGLPFSLYEYEFEVV